MKKIFLFLIVILVSLISIEISLRAYGFLISSWQQKKQSNLLDSKYSITILALGESTTTSPYLGEDRSWPKQLEEILNERFRGQTTFNVVNKGVPGTITNHILDKYEDYLDEYSPDIVTAMMGINDIEVIPITIPAIAGVKNFIWAFIEEIMSAIKSLSLSLTLCISFMYLETFVRA